MYHITWIIITLFISITYSLPLSKIADNSDIIFQGQVLSNVSSQSTSTFLLHKLYKGAQFLMNEANITERYVKIIYFNMLIMNLKWYVSYKK
jgi:hypothetical protein